MSAAHDWDVTCARCGHHQAQHDGLLGECSGCGCDDFESVADAEEREGLARVGVPVVVDLEQGSDAWHAWRASGIGASDVPAIMGQSPFSTPLRTWEIKTGRVAPSPETAAMRRGKEMEAVARRQFEFEYGGDWPAVCMAHPDYPFILASCDGWNPALDPPGIEIKAPGAKTHAIALAGHVPEHYYGQVQSQMFVAHAQRWGYYSYDGEDGVLVVVDRDEAFIERMVKALSDFWACVQNDTPPALSEADVIERYDEEWRLAALEYARAKAYAEDGEAWEKRARAALVALADGHKCAGQGVKVTPFEMAGRVDYAAASRELEDILGEKFDFERFRKPGTLAVKVTVEKE